MPGRNVGNIEVTVTADTGRLQAQLVKAGESGGAATKKAIERELKNLDASIELDTAKVETAVEVLRKQIEAQLRGVPVGLDLGEARLDLEELEAQIATEDAALKVVLELPASELARIDAEIEGGLNSMQKVVKVAAELQEAEFLAEMRTALAEADAMAERAQIDFEVEARTALAKAEIEAMRREEEAESIRLEVLAETVKAKSEIELMKLGFENDNIRMSIEMDVQRAQVEAAKATVNNMLGEVEVEVVPDVQTSQWEAVRARLAAWGGDSGDDASKSFAGSFGRGGQGLIPGQIAEWAPLVGVALGPAVQAIEGLAGGAVQVLSSAFSALGGAAGGAAPLIAGMGAALGAVAIGSIGMGAALKANAQAFTELEETGTVSEATLKKVDKAMRTLTPAARDVVSALTDMLPQFREIQSVVAAHLFEGLASELRSLSQETIPDIGNALAMAGDSANRFAKGLASAFRDIDFSGTFAGIQPALDSLGRAITNVVRAIEPFLKAASPAAQELAKWIEQGSEALLGMTRAGAQSGAITRFLLEGVESLKEWARLIGSVSSALFTLFQAGKSGGDGMIASLTGIVDKWNEWMKSTAGQSAMQDFFATSRQLMSDLVPLIKGVAEGIGSIVEPAAGAGFRQLTEGLGDIARVAGELINVFNQMNITGTVVEALGLLADALERVMPSLSKLATAIGESLGVALDTVAPLIEPIASAIGFLADVLTPLAPVIVGVAIAWATWEGIKSIVNGVQTAMKALNPELVVLAAVAGAAMFAIQSFGAEQREVSARASEVADALETQVNALLETATQATAAQLGVQALAKALASAGTDGEKLTSSLGTLGKTADDSLDVLQSFGKEGTNTTAALTELAKSAGLTGAGVADLVAKVASAEDPFFGVSEANTQLAAKLGISTDELARVGHAMEEVQDQAQKTDIQQMTREFLATSAASTDLNAKLLAQAESMTGVSRNADDVSGLYQTYTTLLAQNAAEANASKESTDALAGGLEKLPPTLQQIAQAAGMSTKAFGEFNQAFDDATDGVFGLAAPMGEVETAMAGVGKAAEVASKKAEDFGSAMEKLLAPKLDVAGALSDYKQGIDDLAKSLEENGRTLDLNTQKGRDNSEQIRTQIQAISDWGEAALASGTKQEDVTTIMEGMRAQLIEQVGAFDTAGLSAEEYINQLGLTPESIKTAVETPGLLEASAKILGYDFDLDGVADNVDTEFTASNLDAVKTALSAYGVDLTNVPDEVLTAFLQENWDRVHGQTQELATGMAELDGAVATPTVSGEGMVDVSQDLDGVQTRLDGLSTTEATPTVTPTGVDETTTAVQGVETSMTNLDSKVASPQVELVNNLIVLAVLATITDEVKKLDGMKASPDVKIPNFGTVVGQTILMTALLTQLGNQKPAPTVTLPTFPTVIAQTIAMSLVLSALNNQKATPSVSLSGYGTVIGQILAVGLAMAALDRTSASPDVHLNGYSTVIGQLNNIESTLNRLNGKVATTTVRNVTENITRNLGGGMAGALITSPQTMNVGERGLREALVPLDLPLSRVNPSVRGFAELLRGSNPVQNVGGVQRQTNVYNTIEVNSQSHDPVAVAEQVVNRSLARAGL